jgi:hypothetical protein
VTSSAPGDVFVEIRTRVGGKPFLSPDPKQLRGLVALGVERTIEQDPAFALRIIADIGIKALSPAVNDPTSAVQILDYIQTFLHRICTADLRDQYPYADRTGIPRVEIPGRTWGGVPAAGRHRDPNIWHSLSPGLPTAAIAAQRPARGGRAPIVARPFRLNFRCSMRASRTVPRCG